MNEEVMWPNLIRERTWTAPDGTTWRMRGDCLENRRARHLIKTAGILVAHVYFAEVRILTGPDRDSLIRRVKAFLSDPDATSSDFDLAEFRDPNQRILIVVQESC